MEPRDSDDHPDDASVYPTAPLPRHERGWRHPSELGAAEWERSEPPVAIGRGLATATGVLSIVLAALVLATLLPTHAGPTATVSRFAEPSGPVTSGDPEPTGPAPETSSAPETSLVPATSAATDVLAAPVPTFLVGGDPTIADRPLAVAIDGGALLVTTAEAVAGRTTLDLVDPSGRPTTARVLLVDESSGLALLVGDDMDHDRGLPVATSIALGDRLSVAGVTDDVLTVDSLGDGAAAVLARFDTQANRPVEGAPVLNQRGELVALCTHGDDAPILVVLDRIRTLRRMLATLVPPSVWLGVVVEVGDAGVRVASLDLRGPAADAGLRRGDTLVAVDGVAIEGLADLAGVLATRRPGHEVVVVIDRDGLRLEVTVELGVPQTAL